MLLRLETAAFSEPGARHRNEDRYGSRIEPDVAAWAVADGLGGHADGDLAATLAVEAALAALDATGARALDLESLVRLSLERAHDAVLRARSERPGSDMATTIVVVVIRANAVAWGHTGDSRIYRVRGRHTERLTRDHSVGEAMRAVAPATTKRQRDDPSGLLYSLGNPDPQFDTHAAEALQAGDIFLLCTDGVWGCIHDDLPREDRRSPSVDPWLEHIRRRILDAAQPQQDNFTAVAIRVPGRPQPRISKVVTIAACIAAVAAFAALIVWRMAAAG